MWQRALRANVPAIEVRSSDYLGNGAVTYFSLLALPSVVEGKPVAFLGDLDADHAWAFTKDVARTLVASALLYGRMGTRLSCPLATRLAPRSHAENRSDAGKGGSEVRCYSIPEMEVLGMHEAVEMRYLFDRPFLVDSSDTEHLLGVKASSLDVMIADTVRDHL